MVSIFHKGDDMKKTFHCGMIALFVGVVFLLSASAAFSITLVPTGLSPGNKYHLAFEC